MRKYSFILFLVFALFGCNSNAQQNNQSETIINKNINVDEFKKSINNKNNIILLDVRTEDEYNSGHIDGALNININGDNFANEISKLDKEKAVYVYCLSGGRSSNAANYLKSEGFNEVYNLQGGIIAWKNAEQTTTQNNTTTQTQDISLNKYNTLIQSNNLVLIDFYAPWCAPCKILSPIVENLEKELGIFKLHKINYDEAKELVKSLNIASIPLLILYKDGKEVWRKNGLTDKETLTEIIKKYQ